MNYKLWKTFHLTLMILFISMIRNRRDNKLNKEGNLIIVVASKNCSFDVFEKIEKEDRDKNFLLIDAVYRADPSKPNLSAEVLSKLLGVKNQGGFRYIGNTPNPYLVVLFTSGEDFYWRDELDELMGMLLYYGDNKTPGTDLHQTKLHGNEILRSMFKLAVSNDLEKRKKIPVVLVFKKANNTRDVKFLGLAVPGFKGKKQKDWLTAVWGSNKSDDRFQNYQSYFTILDTSSGSEAAEGSGINLGWLNDIEKGKAFESKYAPNEWKKYIQGGNYTPLIAKQEKFIRSKDEQLPSDKNQMEMLSVLQRYFIDKNRGYSFENFSTSLMKYMDNAIDLRVTRPYKDGGLDAVGTYKIFPDAENSVYVECFLQAKCYAVDNAVTVKDTSRLISRIKNRQFGIMFTTSYVAKQAYEEILEDGHPIVIINGKNIIDFIVNKLQKRNIEELNSWLKSNY